MVIWDVKSIYQIWVVDEELLDATGQEIDIAKAFLRQDLGDGCAPPLIVVENDDDLIIEIFEPQKCAEVVLPIQPSVRE